jgi:lipoate---protein ligase
MLIINRPDTNPYFNLAAEEYLLKTVTRDCFMLWQNDPCIIVGKHQNALAEINFRYVMENRIPVIRRISGGGTVYHDPGNLNFTFIAQGVREKLVNFRKFTEPVVEALRKLGVPAEFSGKSDICVNGLKVSGNAEHVYQNKVLHHGTLLFSSELSKLADALYVTVDKFHDKGVRSTRSHVTNISDFQDKKVTVEEFRKMVVHQISKAKEKVEYQDLSQTDTEAIQELAEKKYGSWEWNYGYSPDYQLFHSVMVGKVKWTVDLMVQKGIITGITLSRNESLWLENQSFEKLLIGKKHKFAELDALFRNNQSRIIGWRLTPEIILNLLF